ncbi:glycosyltransferase [Prosthecobacter sp.]|uniref:glycosyltransferase n=1 Tax=Prosthecobacter sp. TaxID=1965333 RepID=UPI002ABA09A5|nr:glycosyltransferase [Prosthecobacter sp.]MDZ4402193.1 glycosyltransferase [Prosthecobacter sp.]
MIPKIFHFVFGLKKQREPFHLAFYLCLESCFQVNRPDEVRLYYQHEPYGRYWDMIKPRLTLVKVEPPRRILDFRYRQWFADRYRYAHLSDFVRVEKLLETGGVYADMDTLFVNPIPERLYQQRFVLGRENDVPCERTGVMRSSLCNAFIMAEREAEFGRVWLEKMNAAFDGSWSNHSCQLPHQLSEAMPHLLHVERQESFYKFQWSREDLRRLFEECHAADLGDVLSIHLWSHLWWRRLRLDYSRFHAGKLTEEYVRTANTTYAVAARRFLPEGGAEPSRTRKLWSGLLRSFSKTG